jgi:hypothetical protein
MSLPLRPERHTIRCIPAGHDHPQAEGRASAPGKHGVRSRMRVTSKLSERFRRAAGACADPIRDYRLCANARSGSATAPSGGVGGGSSVNSATLRPIPNHSAPRTSLARCDQRRTHRIPRCKSAAGTQKNPCLPQYRREDARSDTEFTAYVTALTSSQLRLIYATHQTRQIVRWSFR